MRFQQVGRLRESRLHARGNRSTVLLILAGLVSFVAVSMSSAAVTSTPVARSARALTGTATATLRLVKPDGSELVEEGPVSGLLHGSAVGKVHAGAQFRGTFTIRTRSGSISGSGIATPHAPRRYQSFSGVFTVTSGKGLYAHIHGRSGFYGVFDRRTEAVTVQMQGTLYY
jgi:hypothetical protein